MRRIIDQAASEAQRLGLAATIAVVDREGNPLGVFRMSGAPVTSVVDGLPARDLQGGCSADHGLEGLPLPTDLVAISKATTGAFLSTGGHAFSTRTASFIVQNHFPPGVDLTPGGPLFGVQFSSLICSDTGTPGVAVGGGLAPLGLSGDPGGVPLYRDGVLVGGVGVEGDGRYGVDPNPADFDVPAEEQAAVAGEQGFAPPDLIRADNILVDGIRLPFVNARATSATATPAPGADLVPPRSAGPSRFVDVTLGGVPGRTLPRYATRPGAVLSAAEVDAALTQAAQQSIKTRAAIRQPLGSHARVSIAVVDLDGSVLGFFQNTDAPTFGIDVAAQKARTANFFSGAGAAEDLRRAGLPVFLSSDVPLDGSVAFTSRAVGFLSQPYFPPGITGTDPGPFSVPAATWSPFNTGLQLDLVCDGIEDALLRGIVSGTCNAAIPRLPNGITIFPGGVPLFKNGRLAGAIGISGDGVDQDDLIASAGSAGLEAPPEKRCDRLVVRGVRLPYVKFPRQPDL